MPQATCGTWPGNPELVAPCGTTDCCDLDDGETCSSSGGGDACSGLAKKTCKKTAGCAYKKKTCISCSELSKKKCKKTDGCQHWIFGDPGDQEGNCWLMSSISGPTARSDRPLGGARLGARLSAHLGVFCSS